MYSRQSEFLSACTASMHSNWPTWSGMDPVLYHFMDRQHHDAISDHGAVINAKPVSLGHQSLWVWAGRCSVTTQDNLSLCGLSEVAEQRQDHNMAARISASSRLLAVAPPNPPTLRLRKRHKLV